MTSVTLTWQTMKDDRVCPVCRDLDGYQGILTVGQNEFPNALTHPLHGLVWTVGLGSQAHGHRGNCRCHVKSEFEFADLLERVSRITESLERAIVVGEELGESVI